MQDHHCPNREIKPERERDQKEKDRIQIEKKKRELQREREGGGEREREGVDTEAKNTIHTPIISRTYHVSKIVKEKIEKKFKYNLCQSDSLENKMLKK